MKDIILKRLTDKGERTAETLPKKSDSIIIDFSKILKKGSSHIDGLDLNHYNISKYSLSILTQVCYNIDNLKMYEAHNEDCKEYVIFEKAVDKYLVKLEWSVFNEDNIEIFNLAHEKATEETRLDISYFEYELFFDDLEEMLNFIRYYDKIDDNYNILEDYYHVIFIKNKDYKNYLKTKHWKDKRKDVLKRAKHKCQLCSSKDTLHVHHNTYENIGKEKKEDLIVLCEKCHSKFHNK